MVILWCHIKLYYICPVAQRQFPSSPRTLPYCLYLHHALSPMRMSELKSISEDHRQIRPPLLSFCFHSFGETQIAHQANVRLTALSEPDVTSMTPSSSESGVTVSRGPWRAAV